MASSTGYKVNTERGYVSMTSCSSQETSSSYSQIAVNSVTGKYSDINRSYSIDQQGVIGSGYHAVVRQCTCRASGQPFAVKSIRKSGKTVKLNNVIREVKLLQKMRHDNVVRLVDVFEDSEYLHLVTDRCEGGELYDKIAAKIKSSATGCFEEDEAAKVLQQVLTAVSYLHRNNIVHRDIKPENILFKTTESDSNVKLIDFGLARRYYKESFEPYMSTVVGTPCYLAPEVLNQKYDQACDMWSVGVTAFVMLAGKFPFDGRNIYEVRKSIKKGKIHFEREQWGCMSREAKDFVSQLLQKNPKRRMTVEQALNHPFLVKHNGVSSKDDVSFDCPSVEAEPKKLQTLESTVSFRRLVQGKLRFPKSLRINRQSEPKKVMGAR